MNLHSNSDNLAFFFTKEDRATPLETTASDTTTAITQWFDTLFPTEKINLGEEFFNDLLVVCTEIVKEICMQEATTGYLVLTIGKNPDTGYYRVAYFSRVINTRYAFSPEQLQENIINIKENDTAKVIFEKYLKKLSHKDEARTPPYFYNCFYTVHTATMKIHHDGELVLEHNS